MIVEVLFSKQFVLLWDVKSCWACGKACAVYAFCPFHVPQAKHQVHLYKLTECDHVQVACSLARLMEPLLQSINIQRIILNERQ